MYIDSSKIYTCPNGNYFAGYQVKVNSAYCRNCKDRQSNNPLEMNFICNGKEAEKKFSDELAKEIQEQKIENNIHYQDIKCIENYKEK